MTRQRIRQVEQANLHPVDGSLGVFGRPGSCCRATCLPPTNVCSSSRLSICCSGASAAFASAPSSIRASLSIDIAGFSGTTRVFQMQAPPRNAKRARQMSPSVVRPWCVAVATGLLQVGGGWVSGGPALER